MRRGVGVGCLSKYGITVTLRIRYSIKLFLIFYSELLHNNESVQSADVATTETKQSKKDVAKKVQDVFISM